MAQRAERMRPRPAMPPAPDDVLRVRIAFDTTPDIARACGVLDGGTRVNRGRIIPRAVLDGMANRLALIENGFVVFEQPPPEAA
jgi:hypothetical protein